jgi:hypothetical protein
VTGTDLDTPPLEGHIVPDMRVLSLGAGVQSTTIALLACEGHIERPDAAIFADTGWEPKQVYRQVDRIAAELAGAGIPLYRVSKGNLRVDATTADEGRFATVPYFVRNPDGTQGIGRRQCTSEYKLGPIMRKCRELLGAKAPAFRRVPRGRTVEQWIGFSTDEIDRVNNRRENLYTTKRYPLLELGMSRKDCRRYLDEVGWGDTVKSACIGCPYHGNKTWRDMRDHRPDEWADAVAFDHAIRKGGARRGAAELNGEAFLHRSMLPLELAPVDRLQRNEVREAQLDLFEDGDPDGCSPWGCRSGAPVDAPVALGLPAVIK